MQMIQELLSFMRGPPQGSAGVSPTTKLEEKYQELQQSQTALEEEIKILGEKLNKYDNTNVSPNQQLPAKVPEVTIRREFHICGQTGDGGQRDKFFPQPHAPVRERAL